MVKCVQDVPPRWQNSVRVSRSWWTGLCYSYREHKDSVRKIWSGWKTLAHRWWLAHWASLTWYWNTTHPTLDTVRLQSQGQSPAVLLCGRNLGRTSERFRRTSLTVWDQSEGRDNCSSGSIGPLTGGLELIFCYHYCTTDIGNIMEIYQYIKWWIITWLDWFMKHLI